MINVFEWFNYKLTWEFICIVHSEYCISVSAWQILATFNTSILLKRGMAHMSVLYILSVWLWLTLTLKFAVVCRVHPYHDIIGSVNVVQVPCERKYLMKESTYCCLYNSILAYLSKSSTFITWSAWPYSFHVYRGTWI